MASEQTLVPDWAALTNTLKSFMRMDEKIDRYTEHPPNGSTIDNKQAAPLMCIVDRR
jgi:hypothetical protein